MLLSEHYLSVKNSLFKLHSRLKWRLLLSTFNAYNLCRNTIIEKIKSETIYRILLIFFLIKLNTSSFQFAFTIFLFGMLNSTPICNLSMIQMVKTYIFV